MKHDGTTSWKDRIRNKLLHVEIAVPPTSSCRSSDDSGSRKGSPGLQSGGAKAEGSDVRRLLGPRTLTQDYEQRLLVRVAVAEHEERSGDVWYTLVCKTMYGSDFHDWSVSVTLGQVRDVLQDRLKRSLEPAVFQNLCLATFSCRSVFIPYTKAALAVWWRKLTTFINKGKVQPTLLAFVMEFLEAPEGVLGSREIGSPRLPKTDLYGPEKSIAQKAIESKTKRNTVIGSASEALSLDLYGKHFDDYFGLSQKNIDAALGGGTGADDDHRARCGVFPSYKKLPGAWGMKVRLLNRFWKYIEEDLSGYTVAHNLDERNNHVCLVEPCKWVHTVEPVGSSQACGCLSAMKSNTHLVVSRYIIPMTEPLNHFRDVGAALLLNAGIVSTQKGLNAEDQCMAKVFISHSWRDDFNVLSDTLCNTMDPDTTIWVCSFAIWQHQESKRLLNDMHSSPFAIAMKSTDRVVALADCTGAAFKRCWVVFEADLAHQYEKPFDISLPRSADRGNFKDVLLLIGSTNLTECSSTVAEDKQDMLKIASKAVGGVSDFNKRVRSIIRSAMRRAELMGAVATGSLLEIESADVTDNELQEWRSIRGQSVTHIAAARSAVAVLVEILRRTNYSHLDICDRDGHTPLSVAVESGAIAVVPALISLKADVHKPLKGGANLLHFAAAAGNWKMVSILLESKCNVNASCAFEGFDNISPLSLAAEKDHKETIYTLISCTADVHKTCRNGMLPLHNAAIRGNTEAAMALISMNASVNAQDAKGRTPLMFACLFGRVAVASCLLGASAKVEATCHSGRTLHYYIDKLAQEHKDHALLVSDLLWRFAGHTSKVSSKDLQIT